MSATTRTPGHADPRIGERIRAARQRIGLPLQRLARESQCSRTWLIDLENGRQQKHNVRGRAAIDRILVTLTLHEKKAGEASA